MESPLSSDERFADIQAYLAAIQKELFRKTQKDQKLLMKQLEKAEKEEKKATQVCIEDVLKEMTKLIDKRMTKLIKPKSSKPLLSTLDYTSPDYSPQDHTNPKQTSPCHTKSIHSKPK